MADESNVVSIEDGNVTKLEVVRAATNDPALATRSFMLGDRKFPVLDLSYDSYILFLAQLQPLLEGMMSLMPGFNQFKTPASPGILNPAHIVTYCGRSLPEMACIVCQQSDPTMTAEEVKKLGKTPFALAGAVLAQIQQNDIIKDLKDFFLQLAPLLTPKKK